MSECDAAGVPVQDRPALWRLVVSRGASPDDTSRRAAILDDHRHWQLYRASRQGDAAAASAFERHWRRYVAAYCGPRMPQDQVEELIALFFARVYRLVQADFAWQCPFGAYLRTVLVNLTRDHVGAQARRRQRESPIDDEEHPPLSRQPSPEQDLIAREGDRAVRAALDKLAPGDRHVLLACLVDGVPGEEIAQELGISRTAAYQRLSRARRRLKALLEEASRAEGGGAIRRGARGVRERARGVAP